MIEFFLFLAGMACGCFAGYQWGKQDAPIDDPLTAMPQGGGGPTPEK